MDTEKIASWLVVTRLLANGYNPAYVKPEHVARLTMDLLATYTDRQIMEEYRRRLQ